MENDSASATASTGTSLRNSCRVVRPTGRTESSRLDVDSQDDAHGSSVGSPRNGCSSNHVANRCAGSMGDSTPSVPLGPAETSARPGTGPRHDRSRRFPCRCGLACALPESLSLASRTTPSSSHPRGRLHRTPTGSLLGRACTPSRRCRVRRETVGPSPLSIRFGLRRCALSEAFSFAELRWCERRASAAKEKHPRQKSGV